MNILFNILTGSCLIAFFQKQPQESLEINVNKIKPGWYFIIPTDVDSLQKSDKSKYLFDDNNIVYVDYNVLFKAKSLKIIQNDSVVPDSLMLLHKVFPNSSSTGCKYYSFYYDTTRTCIKDVICNFKLDAIERNLMDSLLKNKILKLPKECEGKVGGQ
jgi:hypothetical protein